MNCKKIQEIILTDYLDKQLDAVEHKKIEDHLFSCLACREFSLVAKKSVVEPFKQGKEATPPEAVWTKIKEDIEGEKAIEQEYVFEEMSLLEKFKEFIFRPQPAFALATVIFVVFMTYTLTGPNKTNKLTQNDLTSEIRENMVYLMDELMFVSLEEEAMEEEMLIEEYFL